MKLARPLRYIIVFVAVLLFCILRARSGKAAEEDAKPPYFATIRVKIVLTNASKHGIEATQIARAVDAFYDANKTFALTDFQNISVGGNRMKPVLLGDVATITVDFVRVRK